MPGRCSLLRDFEKAAYHNASGGGGESFTGKVAVRLYKCVVFTG